MTITQSGSSLEVQVAEATEPVCRTPVRMQLQLPAEATFSHMRQLISDACNKTQSSVSCVSRANRAQSLLLLPAARLQVRANVSLAPAPLYHRILTDGHNSQELQLQIIQAVHSADAVQGLLMPIESDASLAQVLALCPRDAAGSFDLAVKLLSAKLLSEAAPLDVQHALRYEVLHGLWEVLSLHRGAAAAVCEVRTPSTGMQSRCCDGLTPSQNNLSISILLCELRALSE